jgi:hypothetical protein
MVDFDDLSLHRSGGEETPPPPSRAPLWIAAAVVLALVAAGVWYFVYRHGRDVTVVSETKEVAPPPASRPVAEPGQDIDLPPLDASDELVRELVARLSSHPRVAAWLTTRGLIRNFTVVVTNIAGGGSPSRHLKPLAPAGAFQVRSADGAVWLDPRSYSRYDGIADAAASIDARGAASLYATLKPRIEEANRDLGGPAGFDATLERAIVALLQTPVIDGDVRLNADSVSYTFEDPALESLTPAQRQLLRMGPRNTRIIQGKLREIAGYLGIPPGNLPPERVYRR